MIALVFQKPSMLGLLLLLPVLAVCFAYAARMRRKAMETMYRRRPGIPVHTARRRTWQAGLVVVGALLTVLALARPGWKPKLEKVVKKNRDVVFVLDVSNSMLAEDRVPNRLENAKAAIAHCVEELEEEQRVGLVLFAGSASIACPPTRDLRFFRDALTKAGPGRVSQGGTRIGDALLKTAEKLLTEDMRGFQDVVLITDGGDHDSEPEKAVEALNERDASLVVIGVGQGGQGARIPVRGQEGVGYMAHDGQDVRTRVEVDFLAALARASESGLFLNAGTRSLDLADLYRQFSAHAARREILVESVKQYEEGFPVFIALAFFLLWAGSVSRATPVRLVLIAFILGGSGLSESRAGNLFGEAVDEAGRESFETALEKFEQALGRYRAPKARADCLYNLGHTAFMAAHREEEKPEFAPDLVEAYFMKSIESFRAAVEIAHGEDSDAARNLELAKWRLHRFRDQQSRQSNDSSDQSSEEDGESSDEQGDSGEPGEEDGEMDEGEGDADPSSTMPPGSTARIDLENQSIPPPGIAPQDLLNEEMINNAQRAGKKAGKGARVEKDW